MSQFESNNVQGMRSMNCRYFPRVNSRRQPGPSKAFPRHPYSVLAPSGVLAACRGSGPATTATAVLPSVTISASPATVGVETEALHRLSYELLSHLIRLSLRPTYRPRSSLKLSSVKAARAIAPHTSHRTLSNLWAASCSCMHPSAT